MNFQVESRYMKEKVRVLTLYVYELVFPISKGLRQVTQ